MNPQTLRATFGGLLHDVGKLVYRAGEDARDHATSGDAMLRSLLPGKEWSGTLDCARYHHAKALRQARMEKDSLKLAGVLMERQQLSMRAYFGIIKVARSIADLAGSETIKEEHVLEAASFRALDKLAL